VTVATRPAVPVEIHQRAPLAASEGTTNIERLIEVALDKGTPVESLEKLFALYERMAEQRGVQEFFEAFAAFQAECPPIAKTTVVDYVTKTGVRVHYTFAALDEITRTANPLLVKHGFSYSWNSASTGDKVSVTCVLRHRGGHSIEAVATFPIDGSPAMGAQQKVGGTMKYGQRQSLCQVLGIVTADPEQPEEDRATISDDQITHLDDLLKDCGPKTPAKFFAMFGVTGLSEIRAIDYARAEKVLRDTIAAREQRRAAQADAQ
jgi:hypothetical protein